MRLRMRNLKGHVYPVHGYRPGYRGQITIMDKTHKDLQRWCNNGRIFYSEENFYKYKKHNKEK